MNVLLAIALVTGLYMYGFPKESPSTQAVISSIAPGSPAEAAGLHAGDRIVQIGEKQNPSWQDVLTEEALNANHSLRFKCNAAARNFGLTSLRAWIQKKASALRVGVAMSWSPKCQKVHLPIWPGLSPEICLST